MKCFDCPGRLYQPGPGFSLENFEIHLKNREHRFNVEKRLNPDWTIHMAEANNSVIDNGGTIPGTIDTSELSSPASGTCDPFSANNRAIGLAEGSITSNAPDFSRLHSKEISALSSSQPLEMQIGTENARSTRGGMEIASGINDVNSHGYETTAIGVFIDNSNGIPQTPKTEAFSSKSKGSL
jgi:hypothetical protein